MATKTKFKLEMKTNWSEDPEDEIRRIFSILSLALCVDRKDDYTLVDCNGNTVGKATWS